MSTDAFQKFKDSTNRVITKISIKTSSSLEKSKIKMHIDSLTKEMQKVLTGLGQDVYVLWLQGDALHPSLVEKLQAVQQKMNEIEQLTMELNSIDDRDNEILGTKVSPETYETPPQTGIICSNCGSKCDISAKFCRKCGNKLEQTKQ